VVSKANSKKNKQLSAKQFVEKFSDEDSRDNISEFSYEGFTIDFDTESYDI
tara:strand:- start:235 stop:387 length:153 start_codon:yes stop_codon:yes gene_type:complete